VRTINYISNLSQSEMSGGWSGVNLALYSRLKRLFNTNYVGQVDPPYDLPRKIVSKALRKIGLPGSFHFFSSKRLSTISNILLNSVDPSADFDFYLGATPWVGYKPHRPYFVYLDASFITYLQLYHSVADFSQKDIKRIIALEKAWLSNASAVFFSSEWAIGDMQRNYGLLNDNLMVAGVGANIEIPEEDKWSGGINFLAMVTDFERKGGRISFEAFKIVRESVPHARLVFVGVRPPEDILNSDGVDYRGFLKKNDPVEKVLLLDTYSESFANLLPTKGDLTPISISELGYFGCPSIAPSLFGIPEMIQDGKTGYLIDSPPSVANLSEAMLKLYYSDDYRTIRENVREKSIENLNWDSVVAKITNRISSALESAI